MIINALNKYYQILAEDEKSGVPLYGYCKAKVSFALIISVTGELLDVISLKVEGSSGKKLVPRTLTVPEQKIRSSGIAPNFICDNSTYVLGIDNKGNAARSKEAFIAFKDFHKKLLDGVPGEASKAMLAFLDNWNVDEVKKHPALKESLEEIMEGSNLVFKLDGHSGYIHDDLAIKQIWEKYNSSCDNEQSGQCLISGEISPIAKLHPFIKNVKNAQSSGASLVSFNANAYESYGKENGYIAPVSKRVASAYTIILNHMLSNPKQKIQVGDATTVFWAESPKGIYMDLAAELLNPAVTQDDTENKNIYKREPKIEALVKDILVKAKSGTKIDFRAEEIDPQVKFYILGLSPNASRISVRFFHSDSFGMFISKTVQHYQDMEIVKDFDNQPDNIPIWRILNETVSPKSNNKEANPLLSGSMMRAILNGGLYPEILYNGMMTRVKTDSEIRVNYIRASIIKAYLLRKARITKIKNLEEVLTVALNEQTNEKPYVLGRLFAILEKTQKDAGNETIRAKYFASAMATPRTVFPILLRLVQHHIAKDNKFGHFNDKRIETVLNKLEYEKDDNCFPSHLTLDEQGIFALGYYHQRTKLWEKQDKENENLKEEK
jgi:CRISPR-associated protein Csd1